MLMLALFSEIIGEAPDYEQNDLVRFPINTILDWPMGTTGGRGVLQSQGQRTVQKDV